MNITLVPNAGLCNRLYCLASAVSYSASYPKDSLRIFWYDSVVCRSRFYDLFETTIQGTQLRVEELPPSRIKDVPASKYNLFLPWLIRKGVYDLQFTDRNAPDTFEEIAKGHKNVYVCHCNQFWADKNPVRRMSDLFVPTKEIQQEIDDISAIFSQRRCIGIHIRRTDNERSILYSPMEKFERHIEQELRTYPDTLFYLATDDEDIKRYVMEKYDGHILSPDFELERNSYRGIKNAVVDLFCLGRTEKIYVSVGSTYSTFASQLYDIPLII